MKKSDLIAVNRHSSHNGHVIHLDGGMVIAVAGEDLNAGTLVTAIAHHHLILLRHVRHLAGKPQLAIAFSRLAPRVTELSVGTEELDAMIVGIYE